LQCTDRSGNTIYERTPQGRVMRQDDAEVSRRRDDGVITLAGALWPEDVWKVQVEFVHSAALDIPQESRLAIRGLRLPDPGTTNTINVVTQFYGSTLRLVSISSPQVLPNETNELLRLRKIARVALEFKPVDATHELRVAHAVDQRGTNVKSYGIFPGRPPSEFRLLAMLEATSLDLSFAVSRSYKVEFSAKPTVVRTNLAHW
jgi:hypothetical protein